MGRLKHRPTPLIAEGGAVGVFLAGGEVAWIDAVDAPMILSHLWRNTHGDVGYAYTGQPRIGTAVLMHRMLLGLPQGQHPEVDHIDGDGMNNRRANLRTVTRGQNMMNGQRRRNAKSRFKGLMPTSTGRWVTQICLNGVSTHLGTFATQEEAAMRYNVAARKHFGPYSRLNAVDMG